MCYFMTNSLNFQDLRTFVSKFCRSNLCTFSTNVLEKQLKMALLQLNSILYVTMLPAWLLARRIPLLPGSRLTVAANPGCSPHTFSSHKSKALVSIGKVIICYNRQRSGATVVAHFWSTRERTHLHVNLPIQGSSSPHKLYLCNT